MIRFLYLAVMFTLGNGLYLAVRARQWVMFGGLLVVVVLACINANQIIAVMSGGAQ